MITFKYKLILVCVIKIHFLPRIKQIVCQYLSNKIQLYTVHFICKLLYIFRVVSRPIIRSKNNCIYSIWYWSTVVATCRYRGGVETDLRTFVYTQISNNG